MASSRERDHKILAFCSMKASGIVAVVTLVTLVIAILVMVTLYTVKPAWFRFTSAPASETETETETGTVTPTPVTFPSTAAPLIAPTTVGLTAAPLVPLTTSVGTPNPGICNMSACQTVMNSYLKKNWAYSSSDFAECANCPVVKYPAQTPPSVPSLVNQRLQWSNLTGFTRYLDCDKGACTDPANKVQIWAGSGAQGQNWTWRNGGLYSGKELLATLANGTANGTPVIATTDSGAGGTGGQAWQWKSPTSGDGWQLFNPMSGRCLDIAGGVDMDGTQAVLWDCDTSISRWRPAN